MRRQQRRRIANLGAMWRTFAAFLFILPLLRVGDALAETSPNQGPAPSRSAPDPVRTNVVTKPFQVHVGDATLSFEVAVEQWPVEDDGVQIAQIVTTTYKMNPGSHLRPPLIFVFNGGPGVASGFLQVGGVGPWRVDMEGNLAAATQSLNADTWLDFADLVFVDPVETGYSHFTKPSEPARKRMLSVNGDADYLANLIRRWIQVHSRWDSRIYLAGESYSGIRVPLLARILQTRIGIRVNGLILLSPLLDTGGRSSAFDPLRFAETLPTLAAVARARNSPMPVTSLDDVESYATGDYLKDLLAGAQEVAALDRVTQKVASITGLDPALVRAHRGRVDTRTFLSASDPGRIGSAYNGTLSNAVAEDANPWFRDPDPVLARDIPAVMLGMMKVYDGMGWRPDLPYRLFNYDVLKSWDWQVGELPVEAITAIRVGLTTNDDMKLLVVHGVYDLMTPYFASKLLLRSIPEFGRSQRIQLMCFPTGHMVYADSRTRHALHAAVAAMTASEEAADR